MKPSSYFRAVIIALVALILLLVSIFFNVSQAAEITRAPVVQPKGDLMVQIGWFSYEREDNLVVLYCIPEGSTSLSCVVYVVTAEGNAVAILTGITATEVKS